MPELPFNPGVAVGLAISALIAIGAPIALAFLVHRRTGASFKYFAIGAAIFFVAQIILRVPWQVPLARYVQKSTAEGSAFSYAFVAFSAFTAGLFEETGRWFGYRFFIKKERSWRVGVMYGLGHGGIESIIFVGLNLGVLLVLYILLTRGIKAPIPARAQEAIHKVLSHMKPGQTLFGGIERLFALCIQVGLSIVVLQVFQRNQLRWLVYAIAIHFVIDFVAVTAAKRGGILPAEIVAGAFAAAFLVLIARLRRAEVISSAAPGQSPSAAPE